MLNLRALLIGISYYDENDICSSLEGAVADVEAMEAYLLQQGVPPGRIGKLKAPTSADGPPLEPRDHWPTYENMVAAIQQLTTVAEPGEHVLIHYCGHGGRTRPTLIPESKGPEGIDGGLVPPDIGDDSARYLRDVELNYLLHQMVKKGLKVTLILDTCHSGGVVRGPTRMMARGARHLDETVRPRGSLVASVAELEKTWRRLQGRAYLTTGRASRSTASTSGWFPGTEGFVLLAACRSDESAYEGYFDGQPRGVLTYSLLEILAEGATHSSFQKIHNRLGARVRQRGVYQTPVVEGDASRSLVLATHERPLDAIKVLDVEVEKGWVRLGGGQAHGLRKGALLQILSAVPKDDAESYPQVLVEVAKIEAIECQAVTSSRGAGIAEVRPGDQAVVIDLGNRFRRQVTLATWERQSSSRNGRGGRNRMPAAVRAVGNGSPHLESEVDPSQALAAVRRELEQRPSGFLELVEDAESPDFQISVNPRAEYEIWYADGDLIPDLPPLPVDGPEAPRRVVENAVHLARYQNVYDLRNSDRTSHLHGALLVELGLLPSDFAPGYDIEPRAFEESLPKVRSGQWVCLSITNRSTLPLEILVLDLQPGWTIEQIHPLSGSETLEGKNRVQLPFEMYLPRQLENQHEILKVVATTKPTSFHWLELPAIGRRIPRARSAAGPPRDELEQLFAEVARDGPRSRQVWTHRASQHWTTEQVELQIVSDRPG